jgi:hypothetical protein
MREWKKGITNLSHSQAPYEVTRDYERFFS